MTDTPMFSGTDKNNDNNTRQNNFMSQSNVIDYRTDEK